MRNKTFKQKKINGNIYNFLTLPNTDYFKFEINSDMSAKFENQYSDMIFKNTFGISHLIEHLCFKNTKDYKTNELIETLHNEGVFNASTNYDYINYYYETIMEKSSLAINLMFNVAFNNLEKIEENEFLTEHKVVENEAKRYFDNEQNKFYFNVYKELCNLKENHNVIGSLETINNINLEDTINLQKIFLNNRNITYNITYDPHILTEEEIIEMIQLEEYRFFIKKDNQFRETLDSIIIVPEKGIHKKFKDCNSEQFMTDILMDNYKNNFLTVNCANNYILNYSDKSLNQIIREENGLTYGIYFNETTLNNKSYTEFSCDVSKNEGELLFNLFKESIDSTSKKFNKSKHQEFLKSINLKRKMESLNLTNYNKWHKIASTHINEIENLNDILGKNIDLVWDEIENKYYNYNLIQESIEYTNSIIKNNNFSILTS